MCDNGQWIAWVRLLGKGQRWEQGNLRLEMSDVLSHLSATEAPGPSDERHLLLNVNIPLLLRCLSAVFVSSNITGTEDDKDERIDTRNSAFHVGTLLWSIHGGHTGLHFTGIQQWTNECRSRSAVNHGI